MACGLRWRGERGPRRCHLRLAGDSLAPRKCHTGLRMPLCQQPGVPTARITITSPPMMLAQTSAVIVKRPGSHSGITG